MNQEKNIYTKKFLSKMVNEIKKRKEYSDLDKVEVFFVFGSNVKTAMCDWVYGMKVYSRLPLSTRDEIIRQFQMDVRRAFQNYFGQSICATDVLFERDY
jgi:abortive infection bacteriophage resistance protein